MHWPGSSILIWSILPSDSKMNVSVSFDAIFISSSAALLWRFLFPCSTVIWLLHHISSLYSPDSQSVDCTILSICFSLCLFFFFLHIFFSFPLQIFSVEPHEQAYVQVPAEVFNCLFFSGNHIFPVIKKSFKLLFVRVIKAFAQISPDYISGLGIQ